MITLQPWLTRIRELSENFQTLKIQHIYREYNREANQLSKKALLLEEEFLYYAKGVGAHVEPFKRLRLV
jgi:hypothetical protein